MVEQSLPRLLAAELARREASKRDRNGYFHAAVAVPLVRQGDEWAILFEVRSSQLAWQPNEICFPGGKIEAEDASPAETALRELEEETGVPAAQVRLLGSLEQVVSPIGVILHPYVTILEEPVFNHSPDEVEELFLLPLQQLLDMEPRIGQMEMSTRPLSDFPFDLLPGYARDWKRRTLYEVYFFSLQDRLVWGLTAQVLQNFLQVVRSLG